MNQTNKQSSLGILCLIPLLFLLLWAVQNQSVALMLMEQPKLILPYLVEQFGLLKLVAGGFTTVSVLAFLAINSSNKKNNVVRGAKVIPPSRLKAILKRQPRLRNQPQLQIAGMPIPAKLENRGFFLCTGQKII